MEFSHLRLYNSRLKRKNEILKRRRRTLQGIYCEVRLDCDAEGLYADQSMACWRRLPGLVTRYKGESQTTHGFANSGAGPVAPYRTQGAHGNRRTADIGKTHLKMRLTTTKENQTTTSGASNQILLRILQLPKHLVVQDYSGSVFRTHHLFGHLEGLLSK